MYSFLFPAFENAMNFIPYITFQYGPQLLNTIIIPKLLNIDDTDNIAPIIVGEYIGYSQKTEDKHDLPYQLIASYGQTIAKRVMDAVAALEADDLKITQMDIFNSNMPIKNILLSSIASLGIYDLYLMAGYYKITNHIDWLLANAYLRYEFAEDFITGNFNKNDKIIGSILRYEKKPQIFESLVKVGADINHQRPAGTTPLFVALETCRYYFIKRLLELDASIDIDKEYLCKSLKDTKEGRNDYMETPFNSNYHNDEKESALALVEIAINKNCVSASQDEMSVDESINIDNIGNTQDYTVNDY